MVLTVGMCRCELNHKEDSTQNNWCFWMWCKRRFVRVSWTAMRSNQSILKKINLQYSLERLMLKLQYFGHLMQRADSLEKTLMLGKFESRREGDDRGWDVYIASLTRWTWVWASSQRWRRTGKPGTLQSLGLQRVGHDRVTEQQKGIYVTTV